MPPEKGALHGFVPEPVTVPDGLRPRLGPIRLLLLDVDGVLTDGRLVYDGAGQEGKVFHVHDGAGIAHWRRLGFLAGLVSGRDGAAVRRRAEDLALDEIHLGIADKARCLDEILGRRGLEAVEVAFAGDDLLDLPVLARVGFAASVPQARPEVRAAAHYVTRAPAGGGAVRELVELLLRAKGLYERVIAAAGRPSPPGGTE